MWQKSRTAKARIKSQRVMHRPEHSGCRTKPSAKHFCRHLILSRGAAKEYRAPDFPYSAFRLLPDDGQSPGFFPVHLVFLFQLLPTRARRISFHNRTPLITGSGALPTFFPPIVHTAQPGNRLTVIYPCTSRLS